MPCKGLTCSWARGHTRTHAHTHTHTHCIVSLCIVLLPILAHADMTRSTVSSNCLQSLRLLLVRFVINIIGIIIESYTRVYVCITASIRLSAVQNRYTGFLCTWWLQYKNTKKYFKRFQSLTMITWLELGITDGVGVSLCPPGPGWWAVWRLAGDNLNITCNFLYCNHQVHRYFLITLY
jgi:hypothetical protein